MALVLIGKMGLHLQIHREVLYMGVLWRVRYGQTGNPGLVEFVGRV